MPKQLPEFNGYETFLQTLKESIRQAQVRAGLAVNRELIGMYWHVGIAILEQQRIHGWGAKVIERLALDLRMAFPEIKSFSVRNLKYMRLFAETYSDLEFVQAGPAQITWYHNTTLLDKVKNEKARAWYISQTVQHGWSRDVLVHQIESDLYKRQGRAITNFKDTLPPSQSELAQQILKDPYNFDFLTLGAKALERDLERGLLEKLRDFLLELGQGFAFMGSQYHLEVGGQDYFLDLLFYHTKLRCFVVVDLKITDFLPEYAGKMSFYLKAIDVQLKQEQDRPTIGLILCKTRNKIIAEYALSNQQVPIGVSEYRLGGEAMPEELQEELPAIETLQQLAISLFNNDSCSESGAQSKSNPDEFTEITELITVDVVNEMVVESSERNQKSLSEIKKWSDERIIQICKNKGCFKLEQGPIVILHIVPLNETNPWSMLSSDDVNQLNHLRLLGLEGKATSGKHTIHGYGAYKIFASNTEKESTAYLHYFKGGELESVSTYALHEKGETRRFFFSRFEKTIIEQTNEYLDFLRKHFEPPFLIRLALVNVLHYGMDYRSSHVEEVLLPFTFTENVVVLPELLLETDKKLDELLKPLLDNIWQACGWPGSPSYDKDGNWRDLSQTGRVSLEF